MRKARHNLTEGSVGAHIKHLSLAMGWGIIAVNAVQFTDMWFISRLGHDALAAISFTIPVTTFLFFMVLAMASGMTSAIARTTGANRPEHAARIVTAGLFGSAFIGILMMITSYALRDVVFKAIGAPENLWPMIDSYMNTWFLVLPFMAVDIVANAGTRGAGEGVWAAVVMTTLALTNLVLNPIFIFGWLGFPAMGMQGSALSTLIAYLVAMVVSLFVADRKMHLIRIATLRNIYKTKKALSTWLKVVAPVSVAYAIEPFCTGILTANVALLGVDAVAAFGVGTRVEGIAMIMLMSMWGAVTPMAGQNWAAGKRKRVRQTIDRAIKINAAFCFGFAGLMWFFGDDVTAWFSDQPRTVTLAALYLCIVPISYVGFGASGLIGSALNGTGRGHWYLIVNVARMALLLAFAVYGARAHGFLGFAIGVGAANLLAGAIVVVWARRVFLAPGGVSRFSRPWFRSRSSVG